MKQAGYRNLVHAYYHGYELDEGNGETLPSDEKTASTDTEAL